jgi:hypothetical protein
MSCTARTRGSNRACTESGGGSAWAQPPRASAISPDTILRMSFLVRAYPHAPERPRDRRGLHPLLHWCVWRDDRRRAIRATPSCWRRPATLRRARPGQCRPGPVEKIRMLWHRLMTRLPATGWTTRRSAISSLPHAQPAPRLLPLGSGRHAQPTDDGIPAVVGAAPGSCRIRTKPACAKWRIRCSAVMRAMAPSA